MKYKIVAILLLAMLLAGCGDLGVVTSAPNPFDITPSRQPIILTATPIFVAPTTSATLPPPPSLTPSITPTITGTVESSPTSTSTPTSTLTPTLTATPTETPQTPTSSSAPTVTLLGCNTSFDVTHGMGEVTNAYVTIANPNSPDLTNVCATLSSADEGRPHPDKTVCVTRPIPAGFQVTLKLTIDTTFKVGTVVHVSVASDQGTFIPPTDGMACQGIGLSIPSDDILGKILPIP